MRVERFALRGFTRFRDLVTVDLTELPPGLIAIVGENGAGKTTLLEAAPAALYRSFLSRGDLVGYATERDSHLEVQCTVEGVGVFRARVNVDGPRRGSDAVIEMLRANGEPDKLNDGKVSTYDQVVAETFPSKELLLASAFASQNKAGSFISLDKKARKTLFMQLLGIERYQTMSETARQAAALVEQAIGRLEAVHAELTREDPDAVLARLEAEAQALDAQAAAAEADQARVKQTIERLEARLVALQDALGAHAAATLRIGTLRQEIGARRGELAALDAGAQRIKDRLAADLATAEDQRKRALLRLESAAVESRRTLEAEQAAIVKRRDEDLAECATKIAGNEKIRGMADAIRAAVDALAATEVELRAQRAAVDQLQADLVADRAQQAVLAREAEDVRAAAGELARARADATLLGTVPCGGSAPFAACQFLTNAAAAAARVPALEATVRERQAHVDAALQTVLDRMVAAQRGVDDRRQRIQELEREQAEHQKLSKYAEPLAAAKARIDELTAREEAARTDAEAALEAANLRAQQRDADRARRLDELAAENEAMVAGATRRAEEAEQERLSARAGVVIILDRLEAECTQAAADLEAAAEGNARALAAQADLAVARRQWDDTTRALAAAAQQRDALEARRTLVDEQRRRALALHARRERLATELLEWQLLAKTFSRDGLPVLEIDAAGPTISTFTNELLEVCFGSRFTVDLVTQQAKADGKGLKESFTVAVTDNLTGESRDIADLSGGEQTLVGEALMNGIAIYVNTRSRMPMRTCWRDETTGALDPANAVRYVEMLRQVQQLGGFHQILFVSHNPDCTAMADVQLQVADGAVTVAHPPFARVERAA